MERRTLDTYRPNGFFCELLDGAAQIAVRDRLAAMPLSLLERRAAEAQEELFNLGITFTVATENQTDDRILPFDVIPRVLSAAEWAHVEAGVTQRVTALNMFLHDLYHDQKILRDGVIPRDLVLGNTNYCQMMQGHNLPFNTYVHVCGTDLVRDEKGAFMVLEDNARIPSGVSYVVENRHAMLRSFPELMNGIGLRSIDGYGQRLADAMRAVAPHGLREPRIVLLSPGTYNSAFFEHVFLAREMGVPLVEGRDLVVIDERVFMRTTGGLHQVDVIYRRVGDDYLDPEVFAPHSMLGVPGLMRAYLAGNVALANAVGTGVADDKAVYAYMPRVIRYYLDQDAILPNVETHICREPEALAYTLAHLPELVVKPVGEAGGYGIVIGPRATARELEDCRARLLANPDGYVSQPCLQLSVAPTLVEGEVAPRHVDLRPFAITGAETWVLPGGLTRVALRRGSLVVNSSQGGGSKDTWVLE